MSVRPHPTKGPGWWVIDYFPGGSKKNGRHKMAFKGTEVEARELEIDLRRGHHSSVPISPYMRDAEPEFLAHYRNNNAPGSVVAWLDSWKQLAPYFAHIKFPQVSRVVIEQYKTQRLADGVKKRTINKELSALSVLIKWAEEHNYCHPLPFSIKGFKKKDTKPPVPDVPTIEEMGRFIAEIPPRLKLIVLLMYHGGLRRSEAFNLKKQNVDLQRGLIRVTGKGNKERTVPILTEELETALDESISKADSTGLLSVSPWSNGPYRDIRGALKEAAKRAGLKDKRIYNHLLRHARGTHGAEAGEDIRAMQKTFGHGDIGTTMIYTHIAAEYQKKEGSKFGDAIKKAGTLDVPANNGN